MKLSASLFVVAAAASSLLPTASAGRTPEQKAAWCALSRNEGKACCQDPEDDCPEDLGVIEEFTIECDWPGDNEDIGFNIGNGEENVLNIKYDLDSVDPGSFNVYIDTTCTSGATGAYPAAVLSDPKTIYCADVRLELCASDICVDVAMANCKRTISASTTGDHVENNDIEATITKTNTVDAEIDGEERDATFKIE
ncbi:MAG: hypothetical protein SGARI_006790, partial [Bacillariaceae sp.]